MRKRSRENPRTSENILCAKFGEGAFSEVGWIRSRKGTSLARLAPVAMALGPGPYFNAKGPFSGLQKKPGVVGPCPLALGSMLPFLTSCP